MAPIGNPHMATVDRLSELLFVTFNRQAIVRSQGSAKHGIRELWIIDVNGRRVHLFRDLHGKTYRQVSASAASSKTPVEALPGVSVDLSFLRKF